VIRAAEAYDPISYKLEAVGRVFSVASIVWLTVAAAILIALAITYFSTMKEIRDARSGADGVFYSDKVSSPAVYGIVRPKIVLPSSLEGCDNGYAVSHEKAHIRRADNLMRLIAFAVAAVHWFNPLSWVFLKLFLSDIELACDEAAIKRYSEDERREYARALLDQAGGKVFFASAFGGAKVKTRIENVLSYKKMTAVAAVSLAAMVAAVLFVLLTNAR
jgi:beta-lactamase regulating signal transducer with metallopeptidase domain